MKHYVVYRHFDKSGQLLYVGRSVNVLMRTMHHKNSKWFMDIHSITLDHCKNESDMIVRETKAIMNERPLHNIGPNGIHKDWRSLPRKKSEESTNTNQPIKEPA